MGGQIFVVQLVQVGLGVGHHRGHAVIGAIRNGQIDRHIDRIRVLFRGAHGVELVLILTAGQRQRDGLAVFLDVEGQVVQTVSYEVVPAGVAHAVRTLHLELQAHGHHKGVFQEIGVIQGQVHAAFPVAGVVSGLGEGAVAPLFPHVDVEFGSAQEEIVTQISRHIGRGVLIGANSDVQQVQFRPFGVQAGDVRPHELSARRVGIAGHLQHSVRHHLGHLHNGVHLDALVGGVPPALVAGNHRAKGGHLIGVVAGQGAAGGADGVGQTQQIVHVGEGLRVALHRGQVAGQLQVDEGVVVVSVQSGIAERKCVTEFKSPILPGGCHRVHGSVIVLGIGVHTPDIQGDR